MKSKEAFMDLQQAQAEAPNELKNVSPSQTLSRVLPTLRDLDAGTIDTLARALVTEVAEGTRSAVDLFTLVTKLALFADTLKENVKGYVYGKTLCEKGAKFVFNGVELSPAELGVKYDFSICQDDEFNSLEAHIKALTVKKKERENFLKTIKGKLELVGKDFEVVTLYEPGKSGIQGYKSNVL